MIRITHILIALGLILLAGVLSAKHLEDRMGVSAVPGVVLVDCPDLGAGALEDLRGLWPGATLEWVPSDPGAFRPFDPGYVARHAVRGDATALFATGPLVRANPEVAVWRVILDGFPGADPEERADAATKSVVRFMSRRSGSRPFLVGVALEPGLTHQAVARSVDRLVGAARTFPESRRTALVVLGRRDEQALPGQASRRWCLRIPVGDWSRRQQADLGDLLEGATQKASGEPR